MNKKKILMPLLLAGTFLLASCNDDKIITYPTWQTDPIVSNEDLKDNSLKSIYEAIKNLGDSNTTILNKVLYDTAQKLIGKYFDVKDSKGDVIEKGLKTFATGVEGEDYTKDELKSFVENHKVYKSIDNYKVVIENGAKVKKECTEDELLSISKQLIKDQCNQIDEEVYEKLFNEIKGGSYNEDGLFYEQKYLLNHYKNLYSLGKNDKGEEKKPSDFANVTVGKYILPKNEKDSYKETAEKYLHFEEGGYDDYINRTVLPDLYQNYLIRTYVKEQRYSSLGKSYARKVNMITVPNGGETHKMQILNMMQYFVDTYIADKDETNGIVENKFDFHNITDAMVGFDYIDKTTFEPTLDNNTNDLLEAGRFKKLTIEYPENSGKLVPVKWICRTDTDGSELTDQSKVCNVYEGTKLGDLVEKYLKVYECASYDETKGTMEFRLKAPNKIDSSAYNDFTESGKHVIEYGIMLKERELRNTSYTKEGWYLKNGGLSELNSELRDRLFNIQTANILDYKDENGKYPEYTSGDYAMYIGNNAFLTGKIPFDEKQEHAIVLDDGSNYNIIQIEEAVSTSKFSTDPDNTDSYRYLKFDSDDTTYSVTKTNEIINDVVKEVSSGDTYKKNAQQYYLMISNVIFHDEDVYSYFKSQYSDLFK